MADNVIGYPTIGNKKTEEVCVKTEIALSVKEKEVASVGLIFPESPSASTAAEPRARHATGHLGHLQSQNLDHGAPYPLTKQASWGRRVISAAAAMKRKWTPNPRPTNGKCQSLGGMPL